MITPPIYLPTSIPQAFQSLGETLYSTFHDPISAAINSVSNTILRKSFFSGYDGHPVTPQIKTTKRTELALSFALRNYSAVRSAATGKEIDFVHIQSQSPKRTGNALVFLLNGHYQYFNRKHYAHLLKDGADILLFNPTDLTCTTMEYDLRSVLDQVVKDNPSMNIALYGYCVGAHVAAKVACSYALHGQTNMPFIFDRGFGNTCELACKVSCLTKFGAFQEVLNEKYNLRVETVVQNHSGPMLVITCPQGRDQLMHRGAMNLTMNLADRHTNGHSLRVIQQGDHWSARDADTWNAIKDFLALCGILISDYTRMSQTDFPRIEPKDCKTSALFYKVVQ